MQAGCRVLCWTDKTSPSCNAPAGCNARMGHRDPSAWGAAWRSRGTLGIQSKSFAWPDQTISDCCIFHWLLLLLFKHFTGSIKNWVSQSPDAPQVSIVLEDIVWYCLVVYCNIDILEMILSDWRTTTLHCCWAEWKSRVLEALPNLILLIKHFWPVTVLAVQDIIFSSSIFDL